MTTIPKPLADHLNEVQHSAHVARALVEVLVACADRRWHEELFIPVVETLTKVLRHVSNGLDDVTLEKVA